MIILYLAFHGSARTTTHQTPPESKSAPHGQLSLVFAQFNRACAVKATESRRRHFEIQKYGHHAAHALQPMHAGAVARFDVVHVLQKRHQPSFRGISTGDLPRVVLDAEAINMIGFNE